MRSHAKASSAGSIQRRVNGLGPVVRGAFATRGASGNVDGSGARSQRPGRLGVIALAVAAFALLALAPSALALSRDHTTAFGSFSGTSPQALFVDPANGDIYAASPGAANGNTVSRFDSSGAAKNFTAGPDAGTNTLTGFNMLPIPGRTEIAIDRSGGPADGDIYVANSSGETIEIFANNGAPLGTLAGTETPEGELGRTVGVAVDQSNGDLYIGAAGIFRYVPSGGTITDSDYSSSIVPIGFGQFATGNLAADQGKVYATDYEHQKPVMRFTASQFAPGGPVVSGTAITSTTTATALSLDPSNGDLYIDEADHVEVYDAFGSQLYSFGSAADFGPSAGVAVKPSGKAYVADPTAHEIDVYGPVPVGTPLPAVVTQSVTGAGLYTATLNATVNPRSTALTDCHFEYVTSAAFQSTGFSGAQSAPCAEAPGSITGASPVSVHADITGLLTNTAYRFRIVATNTGGTSTGDPVTFTTNVYAVADAASPINHTSATLNGHFDPNGDAGLDVTGCQFEWGSTAAYSGGSIPCAQGNSFNSAASVSALLSNLQPGTEYHFRLHLTTASHGEAFGTDQSFIAAAYPITTNAATAIDPTHATLNGHLDPDGDPALNVTDCHFDWGTDNTYSGGTIPCTQGNSFNSAADVSAPLSGLHQNTTYHFRLHITSASVGQFTGDDKTFTTATFPVDTDAATNLHHTDVVLNGDFNPLGDPDLHVTDCHFDWGTDSTYSGGSLPCAPAPPYSDSSSTGVSAFLNNLTPATTYHFRLHITTASAGEFTGLDQAVTAPAFPVGAPSIASFGSDGTSATDFSLGLGRLSFDQANERLYASNNSAGSGLFGFDTSASPAFTPRAGFAPLHITPGGLGSVPGLATGNNGDVYVIYGGDSGEPVNFPYLVQGYGPSGSPLGGNFPIDVLTHPGLGGLGGVTLADGEVDSHGNLWVGVSNGHVLKYDSAGAYQSSVDVSGHGAVTDVAFDSGDNLYVATATNGAASNSGVWRYTAGSGYTAATQVDSTPADEKSIAVDRSTDNLYVANNINFQPSSVSVYDSSGAMLGNLQTDIPLRSIGGIAVDEANHYAYISAASQTNSNNSRKIYVFGAPRLQKAPTITQQDPTAIAGGSVTLNAKVDPEAFAVTDCHFEVVPDSQFKVGGFNSVTAGQKYACAPDIVGSSNSGDLTVHADVSGLNGGNTYHTRIVVSNAQPGGTANGTDQSFNTTGPRISATTADHISDTDAILRASVNPEGQASTYRFQYASEDEYQANGFTNASLIPASPADIGGGSAVVAISEHPTGLEPNTRYRFRVIAQNVDASVTGPTASFTTYATPPSFGADACPNADLRTGRGANLPDCRAYEQASLVDKGGASAITSLQYAAVATDGNGVTYGATTSFPTSGGNSNGSPVVARRTASGWTTHGLTPIVSSRTATAGWDPNLTTSFSTDLRTGAFYVGAIAADAWTNPFSGPAGNFSVAIPAFSDDPQHFLMSAASALTPDAVAGKTNLYDYDHGSLTLADRVPAFPATSCNDNGGPACVGPANGAVGSAPSAISADGSRIAFAEQGTGRLYLRTGDTETTQVSASQKTNGGGPGGIDANGHKPSVLAAVDHTAATIYLTSCEQLTDDSTAVSTAANSCTEVAAGHALQGSDLYSYETASGQLHDLTVDPNAGDALGADVQEVLGASSDGADVYFVANGSLAPGAPAGTCVRGQASGHCELYLSHAGGAPQDLATLLGSDVFGGKASAKATVAEQGALLLQSTSRLTAYDSSCGAEACAELYRYRPGDPALSCVSCDPSGAPPVESPQTDPSDDEAFIESTGSPRITRSISAAGNRVFFQTPDKLVAADVNGDGGCPLVDTGNTARPRTCNDAYEWEADGSGSCTQGNSAYSAQDGGCVYLLSSGTGADPSWIVGASASGDDAFIRTTDQLVPQDQDNLYDVYDVRVGGGLASQHQASPPPCGGPEQCRGQGTVPPPNSGAGTAAFEGPGNSPSKGKNGKHKKHHHKKKRHHNRSQHRRANSNQGGSK